MAQQTFTHNGQTYTCSPSANVETVKQQMRKRGNRETANRQPR